MKLLDGIFALRKLLLGKGPLVQATDLLSFGREGSNTGSGNLIGTFMFSLCHHATREYIILEML